MGAQVSSLVIEYWILWMKCSRKEIFTMSLRNGPHIWFLNRLNDAPIMLCTFIYSLSFAKDNIFWISCNNECAVFCFFVCQFIGKVPPPRHATDNSTFTFYFKYFLRIFCTFYLSRPTFCLHAVLFTLTIVNRGDGLETH
jgi:hypothetical protein